MEPLKKQDPKKIGPYSLLARLGSGGMGTVYLASRSETTVALKVVSGGFEDDPLLRNRFIREIDNLRKVRSPFIAGIVDSKVERESAWLAVNYINGPNLLQEVQRNGRISEEKLWEVAIGGLIALSQIHASGVVHRDIKPANVLLSETGPKLIDFGISHRSDDTSLTTTGLVAGSPAWLAPEQLDVGDITSAVDIFSLASLLVFAGSGQSPWGDQNTMSVPILFNKILSETPDLSGLKKELRTIVEPALSKEPGNRPTALDLLQKAISVAPVESLERLRNWLSLEIDPRSKAHKLDTVLETARREINKQWESHHQVKPSQTPKVARPRLEANDPAKRTDASEKQPIRLRLATFASLSAVTLVIGAVLGSIITPGPDDSEGSISADSAIDSPISKEPAAPPTYVFTTVSDSGKATLTPGEGAALVEGAPIDIRLSFIEDYTLSEGEAPLLTVASLGGEESESPCLGEQVLEADRGDPNVFTFQCEGLPKGQYVFRAVWTLGDAVDSSGTGERETITALIEVVEESKPQDPVDSVRAGPSAGFTFEFLGGGWLSWDSPRKYSTSGNSLIRAWCERGKVGWGWGDNGNWAEIIDSNGTAIETVAQTESTGGCILEDIPVNRAYVGDPAEGRRIVVPASVIEPRLVPGECLYIRFRTHGDYDDVCLRGR